MNNISSRCKLCKFINFNWNTLDIECKNDSKCLDDKYFYMRRLDGKKSEYYRAKFVEKTKELCIYDDNYVPSYDSSITESREIRILKLNNLSTELPKYGFSLYN